MGRLDELKQQVSFEQVAAYYGSPLPELTQTGHEIRTSCFLNCGKQHPTGNRAIAINTSTADGRWKCHNYECPGKYGGDVVTLCHLLKAGFDGTSNPKGDRFKEILADLEAIAGGKALPASSVSHASRDLSESKSAQPIVNLPLKDSENERARGLVNLDEKFIVEPDELSPRAASYFRHRPWLTPDVARQWRMGYLPKDAGGDRSGGTMRGKVVYPWINAAGDVLTWFGRDPDYETNHQKWLQAGRTGQEPIKTRFVKGFHRGLELFGQHQDWKSFAKRPKRYGLLVVEGPNDVIRMAVANVPTVGLCSNEITAEQAVSIAAIAHEHFDGHVTIALDNDAEGERGARDTMWKLAQRELYVGLLWTRQDDGWIDRQPESLSDDEVVQCFGEAAGAATGDERAGEVTEATTTSRRGA